MIEVWGVACEEPPAALPEGNRQHGITIFKEFSEVESNQARAANELLGAQVHSPYSRLVAKFDALFEGIETTLQLRTAADRLPGESLSERFNNVLHAFKIFLEHTPSDLRKRYGEGSVAETEFVAACTAEYDASFDYRLACNLRNEVEHKRDVVDVSYSAQRVSLDVVERHLNMTISDAILDDPVLRGWQAPVRTELRAHSRPIVADAVMHSLRLSVGRILARTLLAQRVGIDAAIELVRDLAADANCVGRLSLVYYHAADPDVPDSRMTMQITPLQLDAATVIETALATSERLLNP